jgi:hypothetical protein
MPVAWSIGRVALQRSSLPALAVGDGTAIITSDFLALKWKRCLSAYASQIAIMASSSARELASSARSSA